MSNNRSIPTKQNEPKTPLEQFKLFYEELPLGLDERSTKQEATPRDRLVRRSRARYH